MRAKKHRVGRMEFQGPPRGPAPTAPWQGFHGPDTLRLTSLIYYIVSRVPRALGFRDVEHRGARGSDPR